LLHWLADVKRQASSSEGPRPSETNAGSRAALSSGADDLPGGNCQLSAVGENLRSADFTSILLRLAPTASCVDELDQLLSQSMNEWIMRTMFRQNEYLDLQQVDRLLLIMTNRASCIELAKPGWVNAREFLAAMRTSTIREGRW
jgi:hypothetical protein